MASSAHQAGSARARPSPAAAPAAFCFEQMMKNKTQPPCSLAHFMDYLVYVEQKAEWAQFFCWYCDYVQRWSLLLPEQKMMSPVWDPDRNAEVSKLQSKPAIHKRSESAKLSKILTIMERDAIMAAKDEARDEAKSTTADSPSGAETPGDWQPDTATQPFRDEVDKVVRHYIAESSPRQLDLFPQERAACLRSTQRTTHPSALLPTFLAADTVLRTEAFPNFTKWALGNANRPRIRFLQILSALMFALGLIVDLLLILSGESHFVRVVCIAFWWPALAVLFSAYKGICVFLHFRGVRALRPWEQFSEPAPDDLEKGRVSVDSSRRATFSDVDPLRKAGLQAFGPDNDFKDEPWVGRYAQQSLLRKVFEPTVPSQNRGLKLLQDRIVLKAFLWAGLISTALTVASIFIPSVRLI